MVHRMHVPEWRQVEADGRGAGPVSSLPSVSACQEPNEPAASASSLEKKRRFIIRDLREIRQFGGSLALPTLALSTRIAVSPHFAAACTMPTDLIFTSPFAADTER